MRRNKYGNKKVKYENISFDSKKEKSRYITLKNAEKEGVISDLELQPTFELIPKVTETYVKHLKTKDKECERMVQRPITYTADFRYVKNGEMIVEDVKASEYMLDPVFKVKEKLFRWKFGFSIKRVFKANEPI